MDASEPAAAVQKALGDFALMILFTGLASVGLWVRRRPDAHRRLMMFAAVSLAAPAIARWPGAQAALPFSVVVPQLTLCAVMIVRDLATRRRVHAATARGVAAYLVVVGVSVRLAASEFGRSWAAALE